MNQNYSDDTKAKLLSQLLLKYQHIINEPKPPLRVTIEESKEQGQELPRKKLKTRSYAWNEYGELMKDSEIIKVRISKAKKSFRRGYLPGWSDEAFKISKVYPSHPTTFELQDLKSETIKGRFYAEELQKISKRSDDYWHVEKILKTKGRGSKKEYYVKWKGFDNRFNSWVKAAWMK
ncbi:uncharacterized transposon-derived protein F54H12.3 [Trichonephila clavata]|uniref:Uncharacterized transposon-derived protein F54H12.3 n=1 Tax=Trichonephila clavata TaxID=2740835 RepID=A0A8X6HMH8_TRICU|nr:uncharacterized transposon-derived protein F54H12.3 [Trichonephila clavata]